MGMHGPRFQAPLIGFGMLIFSEFQDFFCDGRPSHDKELPVVGTA